MKRNTVIRFFNKYIMHIYIGFFLVYLCSFFVLFIYENISGIPTKSVEIWENRKLAEYHSITKIPIVEIPNSIEEYLVDNLPLRTQMIRFYRRTWADSLPPLLNPIVKGKEGHKFSRMTILNYMGERQLGINSLRLKKVLTIGLNKFWKLHNAEYYLFFVPDKPSVYSDKLESWVGESRGWAKQISAYFADLNKYDVNFIDLTTDLRNERNNKLLYNKISDLLHWNGNAVDLLYKIICNKLSTNNVFTKELNITPYNIEHRIMETDIGEREQVPWVVINQDNIQIINGGTKCDSKNWKTMDIAVNTSVSNGTILFTSDSCIKKSHQDYMEGANAAIFPTIHNVHKQIMTHYENVAFKRYKQIALNHKPDIVIDEFVEWMGGGGYNDSLKQFYLAGSMILNEKMITINSLLAKNKELEYVKMNNGIRVMNDKGSVIFKVSKIHTDDDGLLSIAGKFQSTEETTILIKYNPEGSTADMKVITSIINSGEDYLYTYLIGKPNQALSVEVEFQQMKNGIVVCPFPEDAKEFLNLSTFEKEKIE